MGRVGPHNIWKQTDLSSSLFIPYQRLSQALHQANIIMMRSTHSTGARLWWMAAARGHAQWCGRGTSRGAAQLSSTRSSSSTLNPAHFQLQQPLSPNNSNNNQDSAPGTSFSSATAASAFSFHQADRNNLAYSLAFSSDADDSNVGSQQSEFAARHSLRPVPDERMQRQLRQCGQAPTATATQAPPPIQLKRIDQSPLPRTLEDALRCQHSRAVVVTEPVAPFRIVQVTTAWEDLCGYTYTEARNKTLGRLLQGPETDTVAATGLIGRLLAGEREAGTTLTNYTAAGRRFRNRVRVGPLYEEEPDSNCYSRSSGYQDDSHRKVTHFVGVLQEVQDGM